MPSTSTVATAAVVLMMRGTSPDTIPHVHVPGVGGGTEGGCCSWLLLLLRVPPSRHHPVVEVDGAAVAIGATRTWHGIQNGVMQHARGCEHAALGLQVPDGDRRLSEASGPRPSPLAAEEVGPIPGLVSP